MSGIEVVGLVLGVWPVVLNVIDAWKATKGGMPEQSLAVSIRSYARVYRDAISKLLQGDENLTEKDRIGLLNGEKDFASLWQDSEFIARLQRRLDDEAFGILQHKTIEISKILQNLQKKIEGMEPETFSRSETTLSQSEMEKKAGEKKGQFSKIGRMKQMRLALQKKDIKKSLGELKENVNVVRNLLEPFSAATYAPTHRPTAQSHQRHHSEERRARKQIFDDFYEAFGNSFQCKCGAAHEVNLRLSDSLEVIFPVDTERAMSGQATTIRAVSEFQMRARALTIDSQVSNAPNDFEETDNTSSSEIFRTTWSRPRQTSVSSAPSEHRGLLIMFDQSVGIRDLVPITNLCGYVRTLRSFAPNNSPPSSPPLESRGIVGKDGKRYTVSPKIQDLINAPTVVSMDECLNSLGGYAMTRRTRLDLALHLVSAIVQFYPTRWIDLGWTWQNFSMLRGDSTHHLCITRRFWSLDSRRESSSGLVGAGQQSKFWRTIRAKDPLLVRLGFALIELAIGKRLSEIRADPHYRYQRDLVDEAEDEPELAEWQKDMEDWNTANDLVDTNYIQDEVTEEYQRLVATCLRCEILQDGGTKSLSSQSATFEEDLSRYVVEPLRKYHTTTWPQMQVAAF